MYIHTHIHMPERPDVRAPDAKMLWPVCVCMCVCVYIYIYIYTYIYIYGMHIFEYKSLRPFVHTYYKNIHTYIHMHTF